MDGTRAGRRRRPTSRPRWSSPRRARLAQALDDPLARRQIGGVVTVVMVAQPLDRQCRIQCLHRFDRSPGFVQPAEITERGGEENMRERIVRVGLDRPAEPDDRRLVAAEVDGGAACDNYPMERAGVARAQAKRVVNVGLRLLAPAKENLGAPKVAWATTRLRFSASARAQAATPSAARLVYVRTRPIA